MRDVVATSRRPTVAAPVLAPLRRLGEALTLLAAFLIPFSGLGAAGLTFGDVVIALAVVVRVVELAVSGVPVAELRRHQFVLGVMSLFVLGGIISGFAIGRPLVWEFARVMITMMSPLLLVATYGSTRRELLPVVKAFAAGCAVLGLSALVGGDDGNGRALGFAFHPNFLGHSCVMGLAACGYIIDNASWASQRRRWFLAAGANGVGILLSGSRGALLALWVGGFLYLCFSRRPRLVIAAVAASWALALGLSTGVLELPESNPLVRLIDGGDASTQGSNLEREERLESSFEEISQHPLFGDGFESVVLIHVVYYQAWYGAGAIGAVAIMGMGVAMLVLPIGQPRRLLALPCGAAGVAVAWLFTNILATRDQWLFIVLAFRLSQSPFLGITRRSRTPRPARPRSVG